MIYKIIIWMWLHNYNPGPEPSVLKHDMLICDNKNLNDLQPNVLLLLLFIFVFLLLLILLF